MPRSISHVAFTAASFTSLIICIGTLGLWLHSIERLDRLRSATATRRVTLHSKEGEVYIDLARASGPMFTPGFQHIHALPTQYRPPQTKWQVAGLGVGSETVATYQGVIYDRFVEIPLWLVVVISAIVPVLWFDARGRHTSKSDHAPALSATPRVC